MHYYEVAPNKIIRSSSDTFTYSSKDSISIGSIVKINIGKQTLIGVVCNETSKPSFATKPIVSIVDTPALPKALLETALWMASYYNAPLANVLQTILPRGVDKKRRNRITKKSVQSRKRTNFLLNSDQCLAVENIINASSKTVLLNGVTGSGKTIVYIESAKKFIENGKSVIVLVPEIALTPQLVDEFMHHFPKVHLSHSRQTEAERHTIWQNIASSEEPVVVIGPRSALFMPVSRLGAIFVDEAHEPSYKQEKTPRYSALRVASILAKNHQAVAVFGSATPSVADYYLASKQSSIIRLPLVAQDNSIKPNITILDITKKTSGFSRSSILSNILLRSIDKTLESGNQVLLFHNRRGSASSTLCENCGWISTCNRCLIPHTLHADLHTLQCHLCGTKTRVPTDCPECHETNIIHKGIGTKRIEEDIRKIYPNKNIARFDGDTEAGSTVESKYSSLYSGEIDIIIGTQTIAKGLDLPQLRTVGIVQADAGLSLPDYTSTERTFQLLAQTLGRVGRNHHKTEVIVQTYQPNHFSVQLGIKQDFESFYIQCLDERKKSLFPPFVFLLKLTCIYKTEQAAVRNSQNLARALRTVYGSKISIFGPSPAFYERQNDTYRWQIIVKSTTRSTLQDVLKRVPKTHWQTELDPISLL